MSQQQNTPHSFFDSIKSFFNNHYILSNVVLMVIVAIFIGVFAFFFLDVWTNHGRTTIVPEIRKKSFAEATQILDDFNLDYEIADSIYDTNIEPGSVKEVWPHPESRVKPGRVVYLTINSFQPQKVTVTMPLTGVSSRQAMTYLESLNIKNIRIVYVPSNFPDLVEGATYKGKNIVAGMQIPVNANVVLEVGSMPSPSAADSSADDYDTISDLQLDEEADELDASESEILEELKVKEDEVSSSHHNPDVFN